MVGREEEGVGMEAMPALLMRTVGRSGDFDAVGTVWVLAVEFTIYPADMCGCGDDLRVLGYV